MIDNLNDVKEVEVSSALQPKEIAIADIRLDGDTQVRERLDAKTVTL
jgi:hypothetical protein